MLLKIGRAAPAGLRGDDRRGRPSGRRRIRDSPGPSTGSRTIGASWPLGSSRPSASLTIIEGQEIVIGTSIGIALAPDGRRRPPTSLLKHADLALYRAKADGRGTFRFFEPEMDARAASPAHAGARPARGAGERASSSSTTSRIVDIRARRDQRLRGAAALAPSGARHDLAGRVHSRRRRDRPDRPARRVGARGRPATRPRSWPDAHHGRGQSLAAAVPQREPRARS